MSSHTAQTELKLIGKLILEGDITCQTGLHIGAGKGSLEIGGADNPVVKDAFGLPYIPGSSLRGKLRSLLEQSSGMAVPNELVYLSKRKGQEVRIHQSDRPDDEIHALGVDGHVVVDDEDLLRTVVELDVLRPAPRDVGRVGLELHEEDELTTLGDVTELQ